MADKVTDNRCLRCAFAAAAIAVYIACEPALRHLYLLYYSYRMQTIVTLLNYISAAGVFVAFFVFVFKAHRKGTKPELGILIPFAAVYAGYLLSTLSNSRFSGFKYWLDPFIYSLLPILMATMLLSTRETAEKAISLLADVYLILLLLNIVFCYFPGLYFGQAREWREEFFLGFQNGVGWISMTGAFFILLDSHFTRKKLKLIIYLILLAANLYIVFCVTAILGAVIVYAFVLLPFVRKMFQKWDFLIFVGIIVFIFVFFMWFLEPVVSNDPVGYIVEELFGKKRSLSGRVPLWQLGAALIMVKPVLGNGFSESPAFILMTDDEGVTSLFHAHNEFLQTWYEGGIVTLVLALAMLVFVAVRFRRFKDKKLAGICKMALFTFLFLQQADILSYYRWYLTAFIAQVSLMLASFDFSE